MASQRTTRPLRRVSYTKPNPAGRSLPRIEVLECGHEQRQKTGVYGTHNAYARRCRSCARGNKPATESKDVSGTP